MYITKVLEEKESLPFTYLIGWTSLNKYYYGVRYGAKSHPSTLWKSYFTSSTYVKEYRELYGEPDIVEVRKVFEEGKDALEWERKVLLKILSSKNENRNMWLNVAKGQNEYSVNDEVIKKLSKSRKKYIVNRTEEEIERDKKSRIIASQNEEGRRKISEKAKARYQDPEYRKHFEVNVWGNEDYISKLSERTKEWLANEKNKKEWLEIMQSDEYREKQRKDSIERAKDPEYIQKLKDAQKKLKENDPEYLEKKRLNALKGTGNRLCTKYLNKLSEEQILLPNDEIIKLVTAKVEQEFDMQRLIKNIEKKKKSIV